MLIDEYKKTFLENLEKRDKNSFHSIQPSENNPSVEFAFRFIKVLTSIKDKNSKLTLANIHKRVCLFFFIIRTTPFFTLNDNNARTLAYINTKFALFCICALYKAAYPKEDQYFSTLFSNKYFFKTLKSTYTSIKNIEGLICYFESIFIAHLLDRESITIDKKYINGTDEE